MSEQNFNGVGGTSYGSVGYSTITAVSLTQAVNDMVAVEPFPKSEAPTQVTKSGFTRDTRKGTLIPLRVVFGTTDFPENSTVYVKSDNAIHPWAKEVFELEGKTFVIIPKTAILLRTWAPYVSPTPWMTYTAPVTITGGPADIYETGPDGVWRKKG
jgi:hypothetical protein